MDAEAKHPCIVMDASSNPWGPFESPRDAANWASKKWPDQKQTGDITGWDILALRAPD